MQLKRSYLRRVKLLKRFIYENRSLLDVLTNQFDSLSKPVDPSNNCQKLISTTYLIVPQR